MKGKLMEKARWLRGGVKVRTIGTYLTSGEQFSRGNKNDTRKVRGHRSKNNGPWGGKKKEG